MKKPFFWNTCKYGLGLLLLAYVIWKNWAPADGGGIADALRKPIQFAPLAIATLICFASVLLTFVRWYVLVRAQELPFTLMNALRLGLIGFFLSTFLPGATLSGDIFKAAFIAREQSRRTAAVATVLLDRAVGLWGLFWLVTLLGGFFWFDGDPAIVDHRGLQLVILGTAGIVGASVVLWFLLGVLPPWRAERFAGRLKKIPKAGHSASEFWRAVWMYRCKGRSIALALFLSVVGHVGFVSTYYFAAQTFVGPGQDNQVPSLVENFVIVPVGMTVQSVFPTPGGIGGGEYSFGKLFQMIGKPEANGVLTSLVARAIGWFLGLIGYLVYLRMRPALPVSREAKISVSENGQPPGNGDRSLVVSGEPGA